MDTRTVFLCTGTDLCKTCNLRFVKVYKEYEAQIQRDCAKSIAYVHLLLHVTEIIDELLWSKHVKIHILLLLLFILLQLGFHPVAVASTFVYVHINTYKVCIKHFRRVKKIEKSIRFEMLKCLISFTHVLKVDVMQKDMNTSTNCTVINL
jgi:hypothetical protein